MKKLIIASHNAGKVREISALLSPFGIEVVSAAEANLPEPEENGTSFAQNASIKSEAAAKASGLHALSDDSGLCIPALDDAPGIYSARWAGKEKDFSIAMQRIHDELKQKHLEPSGQAAYFICVLALTSPQGGTQVFEGRINGSLTFPPRGSKGFGYDPIFMPEEHQETFAEMDATAKHAISHRARAFAQLIDHLKR